VLVLFVSIEDSFMLDMCSLVNKFHHSTLFQ